MKKINYCILNIVKEYFMKASNVNFACKCSFDGTTIKLFFMDLLLSVHEYRILTSNEILLLIIEFSLINCTHE